MCKESSGRRWPFPLLCFSLIFCHIYVNRRNAAFGPAKAPASRIMHSKVAKDHVARIMQRFCQQHSRNKFGSVTTFPQNGLKVFYSGFERDQCIKALHKYASVKPVVTCTGDDFNYYKIGLGGSRQAAIALDQLETRTSRGFSTPEPSVCSSRSRLIAPPGFSGHGSLPAVSSTGFSLRSSGRHQVISEAQVADSMKLMSP